MDLPIGLLCDPTGGFPQDTIDTDVPYQLYCMCQCQPLLKPGSELAASNTPPTCINLSDKEEAKVEAASKGGNCKDPKMPTQMQQEQMQMSEEEMMAAAKVAATPAPKKA